MEFISIGPYCCTADLLKAHRLRRTAYPFDYIFSSLEIVKHAIKDNFNIFLDKQYYTEGTTPDSTIHTFYCKFLDTDLLLHHHMKENYPKDYKVSSGNMFHHHNLMSNDMYENYKRRCYRLMNVINSGKKIGLVYYNCYTTDFDDLIDFSNNFVENKNIYVVGIFQNNGEQKILYESPNCKIYQNYDTKIICNEVKTMCMRPG